MNTIEKQEMASVTPPSAIIQKEKGISIVWIVPLAAIIVAAGLVYKTLTEKGPTITISFKSAEGLEPGKTKIKYKDVEIGEVKTVSVSSDLKNIIVTAQLVKETVDYLTKKTRFWVVRARLSGGIVSGIGTLFSGSYIAIDPGPKGEAQQEFTGLEIPPVVTSDLPGRHFQLKAPRLGSLEYGSPVYYKGIKVGQVVGYQFSGDKKDLDIKIFIDEPYDANVYDTSRFWFTSGLDMVLDAKGVRIDTQSFVSMMIGGLVFANPEQVVQGQLAEEGYIFPLYNSPDDAMAMVYSHKDYYLIKFDNSVRGLSIGAPVEFRGFPIGKVVDITLEHDWKHNQMKIPVKIEVESERIRQLIKNKKTPKDALEIMVHQGLRAQLKTGNLITGSLYVGLDFFKTASPASLVVHDNIIEIPTIQTTLDELTGNLTALLERLSKIPLEEIGTEAITTLKSLDKASRSFKETGDGISEIVSSNAFKEAIHSLNLSLDQIQRLTSKMKQELPAAVNTVSKQTITTLSEIEKLTAPDSSLVFELKRALKEFTGAAQAISRLADHLERHPESILQGKGKE
jgi:paraquat-inducible protein B